MRIRTLLVMSILTGFISAGCGDRKETKPAPAKTTSAASTGPATIRLTFPHNFDFSRNAS
jgi:hypothetical protein